MTSKPTVGFAALSRAVDTPPESLMRMFGPKGNPSAANLFGVVAELQHQEGIHRFAVKPDRLANSARLAIKVNYHGIVLRRLEAVNKLKHFH